MCLQYGVFQVKVSYPGAPSGASLAQFCGNQQNIWGDCQFHVNEPIEAADAWIVIEDVDLTPAG